MPKNAETLKNSSSFTTIRIKKEEEYTKNIKKSPF